MGIPTMRGFKSRRSDYVLGIRREPVQPLIPQDDTTRKSCQRVKDRLNRNEGSQTSLSFSGTAQKKYFRREKCYLLF